MKLRKSSCTFFAATALALAGCGDSDSTTYTNPVPDLLITTQQKGRKASGAKGSADMSLKDATTKATMLTAAKVMGESSDAQANAQAILDAKAKVETALTNANAALATLQEAKTKADALPADTPKLEELKTELATAITEATRHRDAIQAITEATGDDSLAKLVEKVTGANGKRTPAEIAAAVAVEVEKHLGFRIGLSTSYAPISEGTPTSKSYYELQSYDNYYPADLVPIVSSNLADLPGVRMEKTDYAFYGYWLATLPGEENLHSFYYFGLPKLLTPTIPAASLAANTELGNTANYSGKALGISVLTARDGRSRKAIKSGEFTAEVKLTATFDNTNPRVEGTVKNFKGNAVNPAWTVKLKDAPLLEGNTGSGFTSATYGLTRGSGASHDGHWHGRAYGYKEEERPIGISGAFVTFFSDGRAGGGYGTVKDD